MRTIRIILSIIVFAASLLGLQAQNISIHKVDGTTLEYHCGEVDSIVNYQVIPETENHEAVDLGLSVLWATCNLGAKTALQGGNEYGWGETIPRVEGEVSDYWYYNKDTKSYKNIGENISGTIYDTARQEWGGDWRMPTKEEMNELREKCTWSWIKKGSVYGYSITGSNGEQIFLPASSYYYNSNSNSITHKYSDNYWTSSLLYEYSSWYLSIYGYYNCFYGYTSDTHALYGGLRNSYTSRIRPVKNK